MPVSTAFGVDRFGVGGRGSYVPVPGGDIYDPNGQGHGATAGHHTFDRLGHIEGVAGVRMALDPDPAPCEADCNRVCVSFDRSFQPIREAEGVRLQLRQRLAAHGGHL